jgi:hypothetical protein
VPIGVVGKFAVAPRAADIHAVDVLNLIWRDFVATERAWAGQIKFLEGISPHAGHSQSVSNEIVEAFSPSKSVLAEPSSGS